MDEAALWAAGQAAERRGELGEAGQAYQTLIAGLSAAGRHVPDYVLERLAAVLTATRNFGPAEQFLAAAGAQCAR